MIILTLTAPDTDVDYVPDDVEGEASTNQPDDEKGAEASTRHKQYVYTQQKTCRSLRVRKLCPKKNVMECVVIASPIKSIKVVEHKERAYRDRRVQCDVSPSCNAFIMKRNMKQHIQLRHDPDKQSFVCSQCGKSYVTIQNVRRHERVEH